MEHLSPGLQAVFLLLVVVAVGLLFLGLWLLRKNRAKRRSVNAMKRGNQLYNDWRQLTERQKKD